MHVLMKIIYIHQYFSLPSCPGGTRSYDLASRFSKANHEVEVITTSAFLEASQKFSKGWNVVEHEGIKLHVLQLSYSNKQPFPKRILTFCRFLVAASIRILKIKGDVVLATSTPITIAIPAIVKKAVHKTPFIFEVRDVWPEVPIAMGVIKNRFIQNVLNIFEKRVYKASAHIVPLSEDMKESILRRTQTAAGKLTVIPNISEIERFSLFNPNTNLFSKLLGYKPEKVVLYAGTLGLVNGIKYLVDLAFYTQSINPSIKYIVFGDGAEKEELVQYARIKGVLNQTFYFFAPVPKAQLPQIYYECTVAVSSVIPIKELWSNSANKFFDCFAAGRPIVINHLGWQARVIEKKKVGFVLDYHTSNIPHEAERICQYLSNADLLSLQGENAKRLAEREYSLDVATNNYLKVLNNVV